LHTDPYSGFTASSDEMLFIARATALNGINQLCELIEVLDAQPAEVRDRYLAAASNILRSTGHIVASAWLSSVRVPGFDARAAAATLAQLRETASKWKNSDMVIELTCAQAVMLDEYANDKDEALKVLDAAQANYPHDYRISRQRQKLFYRHGNHALALTEFESFAATLPATNLVDRAFAMREAGRSAAEVGDLEKTRLFFEMAWESARQCGAHMLPMVAGLSADCAVLDFQANRIESALALMLRALTESESIDPKAGLNEHYCLLILVVGILWMRGGAAEWPVERQAMTIGMCSHPDPLPEMMNRRLPQHLLPWYQLAELEADISESQTILTALRQRTAKSGGLLPMETTLVSHLAQAALRNLNVARFIDLLSIYPRAVVEGAAIMATQRPEDIFTMPSGVLKPIRLEEWNDRAIQEVTASAALIFAVVSICSGRLDLFDDFRGRVLLAEGIGRSVVMLFDAVSMPKDKSDTLIGKVARILSCMLQSDFIFDAGEAFGATVYLVQLLSGNVLGETAAGPIVKYFSQIWRDILVERAFSVRNPTVNGQIILSSAVKGTTNRAKLANLVLASEAAVRGRLSDELRASIRKMADPQKTSLEDLRAVVSATPSQ
jgi:hypothetical protein